MSLLKRVEQAQQRASALNDGTIEIVVPPPPVPVMAPSAATISAREDLLRQIRLRLQAEVMIAFDSLLDIDDPEQLRIKVDAIVDRVLTVHGYAVTHDEREHLAEELVGEVGGLGRSTPSCSTNRSPRSWSTARATSTSSVAARSSGWTTTS